jgi:hypothetical protein
MNDFESDDSCVVVKCRGPLLKVYIISYSHSQLQHTCKQKTCNVKYVQNIEKPQTLPKGVKNKQQHGTRKYICGQSGA